MPSKRKYSDQDLLTLNALGLTTVRIAQLFNCHQTAISARLKHLGAYAANNKKKCSPLAEYIVFNLTADEFNWLCSKVKETDFKAYLTELIKKEYVKDTIEPRSTENS